MNCKELAIDFLEIAEINLLMSIKDLKPENITKTIHPELNPISWIVGHCVSHMDFLKSLFTNDRKLTKEQRKYFTFGVEKEVIKAGFPYSFKEIIELYLELSESCFKILKEFPEEKYDTIISDKSEVENLYQNIQRISLHYMGHTGQIVMVRRALEGPNWSYVGGISKELRKKYKNSWIDWWEKSKNDFV